MMLPARKYEETRARLLAAIDDVVEKLGEDRRRLHDKGTSRLVE